MNLKSKPALTYSTVSAYTGDFSVRVEEETGAHAQTSSSGFLDVEFYQDICIYILRNCGKGVEYVGEILIYASL